MEQQSKPSKSAPSTGFDYYLESLQKETKQETAETGGQSIGQLLKFLVEEGPIAVDELPSRSGIPYKTTIQLIPKLLELEFVDVTGEPGSETIELTETGTAVAKIEL
jgi:predicted transcriptional regulator